MPKRTLKGRVRSDKADKTISVQVIRKKKHPLYHKVMTFTKNFAAHDEKNEAKMGDLVAIEECRPYSKSKTWTLKSILGRAV